MIFTDDPIADFERYDSEQQAMLDELPLCEYCEEPIQDNYYYEIDNECICEDCLNRNFRKECEY